MGTYTTKDDVEKTFRQWYDDKGHEHMRLSTFTRIYEGLAKANISPPKPDDVAEAVKYAQIEVDRIKLDMAKAGTVPAFNARVSYHHLKTLIRAARTLRET